MAVDERLLARAKQNPAGLAFDEALSLAKQLGWIERKARGSHRVFLHPLAFKIKDIYPRPLNLQSLKDGKAKDYQVRQMIQMAMAMRIIEKD